MCGRYALVSPVPEIESRTGAPVDDAVAERLPRYNAAPGQDLPVLRDAGTEVETARWGFVPERADRRADADHINARAETIGEKPTFEAAYGADPQSTDRGRCLVPADGFYEWSDDGPHYVSVERGPALLAGVWETWTPPSSQTALNAFDESGATETTPDPVRTFAVLTTEPNGLVADLHHRMAVIVTDGEAWLREGTLPDEPFPAERMRSRRVSTAVNDPANDSPAVLTEPAE